MDRYVGPQCIEFEAATDSEAIEIGDERRRMALAELWSNRRKIKQWEALSAYPQTRRSSASLSSRAALPDIASMSALGRKQT
jgi:hypothetical protein